MISRRLKSNVTVYVTGSVAATLVTDTAFLPPGRDNLYSVSDLEITMTDSAAGPASLEFQVQSISGFSVQFSFSFSLPILSRVPLTIRSFTSVSTEAGAWYSPPGNFKPLSRA
ncbi:hypothetical protein BaRGS_00021643 [Batillaria attramentaria]|uniref:Uncharacterized protein n=1 Tax=Batillaria attramentaria TaxID=370345 RepID=A0ABD0KIU8_9CAEN